MARVCVRENEIHSKTIVCICVCFAGNLVPISWILSLLIFFRVYSLKRQALLQNSICLVIFSAHFCVIPFDAQVEFYGFESASGSHFVSSNLSLDSNYSLELFVHFFFFSRSSLYSTIISDKRSLQGFDRKST